MNRFVVAVLAVVVTITVAGCGGIVKANRDASTGAPTSTGSPTVASISPNSGDVTGGTSVSITGTNFLAGALVLFGTTSASNVTVNSSTQIQAVTPARVAGLVDVTVRNPDGQSGTMPGGFTYTPPPAGPPSISSISPNSATPGTQVTINGANFASNATVSFGSTAASMTFVSRTQFNATVPSRSPGVVDVKVTNPDGSSATLPGGFTVQAVDHSETKHYFYNIPWTLPVTVEVYDMDLNFALVRSFVPDDNALEDPRGMAVSANGPTKGTLYISYGCHADLSSCAGGHGGHLLAYNLNSPQPHLVWNREYPFGIDSFSITPDGLKIYMPTGENSTDTHWQIIDAVTGNRLCDTCAIDSGQRGPHNTVVSNDGTRVYLGAADNSNPLFGRNAFYLIEADTATNQIIHPTVVPQGVGPVGQSAYGNVKSVRPFTIGFFGPQRKQYALINDQTLIGFDVGNIDTGEIRFRVGTAINPAGDPAGEYTHGITLSPDSKVAYVVDATNNLIHAYDVSGISDNIEPSEIRTYSVTCSYGGPPDSPCLHWLLASRDGHYIFVANTNHVIDAWNLNVITTPDMAIGDKFTEVTVTDGLVTFAPLSRSGVGY